MQTNTTHSANTFKKNLSAPAPPREKKTTEHQRSHMQTNTTHSANTFKKNLCASAPLREKKQAPLREKKAGEKTQRENK